MIQPKLIATFKLNAAGDPLFSSEGGLRHYEIELKVEDAPEDLYGATFELDPTYYDPIRTVRPENGVVALDTTSYGDYGVTVQLRSKSGGLPPLKATLARALRETYQGPQLKPSLRKALDDISSN